MTIRELLNAPAATLSYELFPPRTPAAELALWDTIAKLATTAPDFASITYGASGSTRGTSRAVVKRLAEEHTIPPLAHLTCVDQSRAEVTAVIEEFMAEGVRDFLALRGDPPAGQVDWTPHPDGLLYASDLVRLIRDVAAAHGIDNLSVGVTAFPAQHAQEQWRQQGLDVLKAKQDAGADFAVTQVFYDGAQWEALATDARAEGIGLPILPGIIALPNAARAARLEQLTGVPAPASTVDALLAAGEDPDAARAVGVATAAALARDLLDRGAPGIHIYTFNKHQAALELVKAIGHR
ncbi:MAG: 5,10-methylenetetrahydrofolate reductase [Actinobacteria bacterium HGW-Actinobacteria-4]|nr:MAG: 5,10-methylenetetrahydrofolate reductase [Actinobacteria bacterium HGW-Actinobacteria-4]